MNSRTFLDIPLDVFDLILEKLKPMELLISRDVCRSLRTAVDRFGFGLDEIEVYFRDENLTLKWKNDDICYFGTVKDGTIVLYDDGERKLRIEKKHFVGIALCDLRIFLKHASMLTIYDYLKDRQDFIESFIEILKSDGIIKVKEIVFFQVSFKDAIAILPYFDAEVLDLQTTGSINQFEQMTHLSQWKNCKTFKFSRYVDSKLFSHMFHFENFNISMLDFNTQIAMKMRDDLMRRSTFQSCRIYFNKWNPIELAKVFKPDYSGGNVFKIKYSNSDYTFTIKCKPWHGMAWSNKFTVFVRKL